MKLENSFDVPVAPAEAWRVLIDVERVAPCVPGAALTEVVDANTYKGTIKVKLGPVSLAFDGEVSFTERDDDAFTARLAAAGREGRNRGSANADVDFALAANGDGTKVSIVTDLQLAGPIAQYGRSQGVIASVSAEMIDRFAACLKENILDDKSSDAADAETAAAPAPAEPVAAASGISIMLGALKRSICRFMRRLTGKE
ncbi:MAG: SRPBCC family protein [Alphaproteobacteria bacterium]|nr:SRPBCC family protein [Alphaproteobacteria bacterium]